MTEVEERKVLTRMVVLFILVFLFLRFLMHATVSHFLQPPLFLIQFDMTHWLYRLSGIPEMITNNQTAAWLFDILLFSAGILIIVFPLKRLFIISFTLLFIFYVITYNTYVVHNTHSLTIMSLITFPFWAAATANWKILWQGMRYYVCFIYTASFIWKTIFGNAFFSWHNGVNSVKLNNAEYLYHYPNTISSAILKYFISHPVFLNVGNMIIFLLEGLMAVGFFTKKFDRYLILFPVIIHLATYFFIDVYFIEMLVLIFVFFTYRQTEWVKNKIPLLTK